MDHNYNYKLYDNVYIVKGSKRACIYDLNNSKLYSINMDLYDLICDILLGKKVDNSEMEVINNLIENNILLHSEKPSNIPDIQDLKTETKVTNIHIEITKKCNLKCIHCYEESSSQLKDKMDIEEFKYTIDQIESLGTVNFVQLIGGEPLVLKKDIKVMLDYCLNKFETIEIFTNLTLLNDELIEYFKLNNIKIGTNRFSYNNTEHEKVTQISGSSKKQLNSIKILKDNSIPVRVGYTKLKDVDFGEKTDELFELNEEKGKKDLRVIGRASLKLFDKGMLKDKIINSESFTYSLNSGLLKRLVSGHNCFSHALYIDTELNIFPCCMERRFSYGNMRKDSLKNIVENKMKVITKDDIKVCKDCEYRYICFDCRPDSMSDDIYEKPWYCTYNPYTGEWDDEDTFINNILEKNKIMIY